MGRIVGIDLGTTNTAVAVLQDGRPRVIEDDRGYKVLPSVVSARGEGRYIVGQAAHNLILTHPDRTVYATKRLIGRRFDSVEVQRMRERVQYQMRPAPDGSVQVQVGDQWMSPAEVAAVVLQVARTIAEKALGEPVDEAVITVPAHFNHLQREQTMEAARIAGLKCDRLLNEPTAAALAYGHRKNVDRTLVIFDLGGGTFDVSVLRLSGGIYEILSTAGDTYLGGEDFDYRIVDHLADHFQARTMIDVREDRNALQRLKDAAERAKCDLSFSDRTNVVVPHITPTENLELVLSRTTLESLTNDLITRCLDITRQAVADAGLQISEVDEIVLVGGQTRMPRVREAVSALFGREPSRTVHPEEAVAVGAAVHASSLSDPEAPAAILLDVTPFDLGIDAVGGHFTPIILKNARIPCSEAKTFATVHDNQSSVRVTVRQGESRVASENEFLGEFVLEGISPAPKMQMKVDITFRIDTNGLLNVSATDRAAGEKKQITVRNYAERASTPHIPSTDEAAADRAARARRTERESMDTPSAALGTGAQKKAGFLSSLFGAPRRPTERAGKSNIPLIERGPAMLEPPPEIDMSAVPVDAVVAEDDVGVLEDEGGDPIPTARPLMPPAGLPPIEEDDLYGHGSTPASFGLAGTAEAAHTGEANPDPFRDVGLDASDLFAGMPVDESSDEPETDHGRSTFPSTPDGGAADADPFAASNADIFNEPPPRKDVRLVEPPVELQPHRGPAPTGLVFEGMVEGQGSSPPESTDVVEVPRKVKKPARLKLHYRERDAFLSEYRDNLRRGGTFIRTEKPLAVGRECVFEIDAPGLVEPLVFSAVVSWISNGRDGQAAGMGIEYRLSDPERADIDRLLSRL